MKTTTYLVLVAGLLAAACDRKNEGTTDAVLPENFPAVILVSDELDGGLEDNDAAGVALEILPVWDAQTRDPEGRIPVLSEPVTVNFVVEPLDEPATLSDYILGAEAFYEIDDCTTSLDEGIDLSLVFNPETGEGSVNFPSGVAEMEIEFELNPDLFSDDVANAFGRGFAFEITGLQNAGNDVKTLPEVSFEYVVLDDESVFGDWELDATDAEQLAAFLDLFGTINPEIGELTASEISAIEFSFGFESMTVLVELTATEEDECDPAELVNEELEVEADYEIDFEELFGATEAELEMEGGADRGSLGELEFVLEGGFAFLNGSTTEMELTLSGELDGDELPESTFILTR